MDETCRTLSACGGWAEREEIGRALASTVAKMLVRLARADEGMDASENELIRSLIRLDRTYDGNLAAAMPKALAGEAPDGSLQILRSAAAFDAREGTSLAREAAEAFEALGYAIVRADGRIVISELDALQSWIELLYEAAGDPRAPHAAEERVTVGA
ncbi:MAG: hypothetical protein WHU10_09690 [Fimbriimonadales bacterium]